MLRKFQLQGESTTNGLERNHYSGVVFYNAWGFLPGANSLPGWCSPSLGAVCFQAEENECQGEIVVPLWANIRLCRNILLRKMKTVIRTIRVFMNRVNY